MPEGTMAQSQGLKVSTGLTFLLGIWLFVSPWVYGSYYNSDAWNSWIVGALIALFAAIRLSSPASRYASSINIVLGIWTFISPWIFGYTMNTGRFVNSLGVGIAVFILAAYGASVRGGSLAGPPTSRTQM